MLETNDLKQQIIDIELLLKKNPQDALAKAKILQKEKAHYEPTIILLARCQRFCGQLDTAQLTLEELLKEKPLSIFGRLELAIIFDKQNLSKEAINTLTDATKIAPEFHEIWEILSQHLFKSGDKEGAMHALNQYEMIKSFNVQLANANEHFHGARFFEAEEICRRLLQQVPTEARALKLLAQISSQFGHFDKSLSILEDCLQIKPESIDIRGEYASVLLQANKHSEALEESIQILNTEPQNISTAAIKAESQVKLGHYEDALATYEEIKTFHPRKDLCLLRMGNVLNIMGQTNIALQKFKEALQLNPGLGEAYWDMANLKSHVFSNDDISTMKSKLNDDNISKEDQMFFNFSMGKALEDNQEYSDSFNHYKIANDICLLSYPSVKIDQYEEIKSFFTTEYFNSIKNSGHSSNEAIFIVGLRRSGSTLVEQILASHSLIEGTMELKEISSIARSLTPSDRQNSGHYTTGLANVEKSELEKMGQRYLEYVANLRHGAPFFTDKLPDNFSYIGLIKSILPNAKIIDVRRDPMACGWSLYRQYFSKGVNYSYDLTKIAQYYNRYVDLMEHWHSILPGEIFTVNYHDLINDHETTVKSILDYCGIDFEQSCLEFYKNKRPVATISAEQVRQPLYKDALNHWQNFETYMEPFKEALDK